MVSFGAIIGDEFILRPARRTIPEVDYLDVVGASGDELIIKHILDSLAPLARIQALLAEAAAAGAPESLVDLGTGAGLPGIPLSLALPGIPVTLLDRMTRRIRFPEAMVHELPLPDATIAEQQGTRA